MSVRDLLAKAMGCPSWMMQAPSPLSEASHWRGDQFGPIVVSQGSEEGFLQLGLYFLEEHVGVFVPGKAVLLFEEGPEGFSV